eukprot:TRINITY_DN14621_c0_g1_i1.p1 TRINITY_DN14621_c0_g1~~TRINITY_DN14621_c0_g1_i1.p1  ORF type:complete len:570 (-),score=105.02 TRINITY_DN14621_c0_g1_i1:133-1842(-)
MGAGPSSRRGGRGYLISQGEAQLRVGNEQWHFLQETWKKLTKRSDLNGELTTREAVLLLSEGLECSTFAEVKSKMDAARNKPETGLQATFSKVIDVDKNGSISWSEFVTAWALLSRGMPEEKARACFMALDENEDGELSREEISKFWDIFQHIIEKSDSHKGATPAQSKQLLHKLIDKLFLQADKDKSGTISLDEYLSFVSRSQDSWVLGYCLGLAAPSQDGVEDQIVTGLMRELNDEWVETAVMIKENGERIVGQLVATPHRLRFDAKKKEHRSDNIDANLQNVKKAQIMPHDKVDHEDEARFRVNIFDPPVNKFYFFAVNKWRMDQFFRVLNKWQVACHFAATKQTLNLITAEKRAIGSPTLMRKPSYADSLMLPSSSVHQHQRVAEQSEPVWMDLSATSFLDTSKLLTEQSMRKLQQWLPPRYKIMDWKRLFYTGIDGVSLQSFFAKAAGHTHTIVMVRDDGGAVFGAFTTMTWKHQAGAYGTGESFLFSFKPTLHVYKWSSLNSLIQTASNEEGISVGGGKHFGLWISASFDRGSSGTCETFLNRCLATHDHFNVASIELWGFES